MCWLLQNYMIFTYFSYTGPGGGCYFCISRPPKYILKATKVHFFEDEEYDLKY